MLTIGGAVGALFGGIAISMFPQAGVTIPLAALVGMSALFAGASRAFLTSVIFAVESTAQAHALLPLLATCGASYVISYLLMKNTIMTEKIARRGIRTPDSYQSDLLEHTSVGEVVEKNLITIESTATIRNLLDKSEFSNTRFFVATNEAGGIIGLLDKEWVLKRDLQADLTIDTVIKAMPALPVINQDSSLRSAAEIMAHANSETLLVADSGGDVVGFVTSRNIFFNL